MISEKTLLRLGFKLTKYNLDDLICFDYVKKYKEGVSIEVEYGGGICIVIDKKARYIKIENEQEFIILNKIFE